MGLSLIGLIMVNDLSPHLLTKQLSFLIAGATVFFLTSYVSFDSWFRKPKILYLLICLSLLLPFLLSQETRQTARWIHFGDFFSLQPSQFALPLIGLVLINFLSKNPISNWTNQLKAWCIIFLPWLLIILAPNLSTGLLFFFLMSVLFFLSGLPIKHTLITIMVFLFLASFGAQMLMKPYQKNRVLDFLNSLSSQETENSYNATQSLIAVGGGGWWGKGAGKGSQAQLAFLPEKNTDFIFAAFAEQFGLIGSISLIVIYIFLTFFLYLEAGKLSTISGKLYLYFIALMFSLQTFVAVGTNIGLLPITGLTLPFISTGGSSLLAYSLCFGVGQNLIKNNKNTGKQLFLV